MGHMTWIKGYQTDMALCVQTRDLVGINLVKEDHIVQSAFGSDTLEFCRITPSSNKKKPNILPIIHSFGQLDEYPHSLRNTHITGVNENAAAR